MSTKKTFAQIRGDLIADIEAVRMGRMSKETAAVIFAGYKELTATVNAEVAVCKTGILAEKHGKKFVRAVRLGALEINGEEKDDE